MNYQTFYESFNKILDSLFPNRTELVGFVSDVLHLDRRAVSRRLNGDYQFRMNEVLELCSLLDISLDRLVLQMKSDYYPPSFSYYPLRQLSEKVYSTLYRWIERYRVAAEEKGSYVLIACNILPDIFCFQYEYLLRLAKLKGDYYMNDVSVNPMNSDEVLEEARWKTMREYISAIFAFEKLLIIWDYNIIPSLIYDIEYFAQIGYVNAEHKKRLKEELLLLIDKIDSMCKDQQIFAHESSFTFAVSSVNLQKSHFVIKGKDLKVAVDSAFYTTYLYVSDPQIVTSVEHIIWSILKSSVIISQSNERERTKFIKEQRTLVEGMESGL